MTDRSDVIAHFIQSTDWKNARVEPLAGDASNRRYLRLTRTEETAVLMDAPSEKGEDVRPFVEIATYLTSIGLSAPKILEGDVSQGILLLEDLGDDLFARYIPAHPNLENSLYYCATDLLIHLHRHAPPSNLDRYSVNVMSDMSTLCMDWYLDGISGIKDELRGKFYNLIQTALQRFAPRQSVLIQRDYHAENLLWLPGREGIARVGLLDFQDAMMGHPAYDLVSLLQDARRDVAPEIETKMVDYYVRQTEQDPEAFKRAYYCLGAQRNLRILGVFARLCLRDGKKEYVDLIPRVWNLLQRDLTHPSLSDLASFINAYVPLPTLANLKTLKQKCATNLTLL